MTKSKFNQISGPVFWFTKVAQDFATRVHYIKFLLFLDLDDAMKKDDEGSGDIISEDEEETDVSESESGTSRKV